MVVVPMTEGLPAAFLSYATGKTNNLPNTTGIKRREVQKILEARRRYIRSLLLTKPKVAYALPDFEKLMREEIWSYAKRELLQDLFENWDERISEISQLRKLFRKELEERQREYFQRAEEGRPIKKLRYIEHEAMRHAFRACTQDPEGLGNIELACLGKTRYGC